MHNKFNKFWSIQAIYSVRQAAAARKFHGVKTESDYAWRYLTGRLERFKTLGLPLPLPLQSEEAQIKPIISLRFTAEELEKLSSAKH
jgi:hypothetical protein